MASYEISGPGGATYQVQGPDGADPSAVIAQLAGAPASAQASPPGAPPTQVPALGAAPSAAAAPRPSLTSMIPTPQGSPAPGAPAASLPSSGAPSTAGAPTDWTDRLAAVAGRYGGPAAQQIVRDAGIAGSGLASTAAHTALMIPDAMNSVYQLATNPQARAATLQQLKHPTSWLTPPATAPSTAVDRALATVAPTPQTWAERAIYMAPGLLAGARLPLPFPMPRAAAPADFIPGVSSNPQAALAALTARSAAKGLNATEQDAATAGQALGFKMTPGQASGSVPLRQFEARLESRPATSGPFAAIKSGNQANLNRIAAAAIGEDSNVLDADTLGRANARLGQVFENVRSSARTVAADPASTKAVLDQVDQDFDGLLPGDMSIRDNKLVGQLERLTQSGSINGQQLGQLSSKLGKAAYKQMATPAGDRDLGQALYQVKDHVDDLVQSTLTPEEAAEYATARGQYRNLMTLTSRANIVNSSSGNVSGTALASKLEQSDKQGFKFGKNQTPLYQAARFAGAFKPIVGDSGTATRSGGHGLGLLTGLGIGELGGDLPLHTRLGLLALPAAGRLAANLGTRAYLTRPGAAFAQALLRAPRLARRTAATAALPWRALTPRGLPRRLLAPALNPGWLALPAPSSPQPQ